MAGSRGRRRAALGQPPLPGLGVDYAGGPVVDPTQNVLDLVTAAIKRQDDLRNAESRHVREIAALRAEYTAELRKAETARIDAIRAVDVGAVNRAAEVSAQQATTLATQVATSAETLRTQVAAAATASANATAAAAQAAATALAAALDPIQKDIADLRRAQYEAQGVRANVVDARDTRGESRLNLGSVLGAVSVVISLVVAIAVLLK